MQFSFRNVCFLRDQESLGVRVFEPPGTLVVLHPLDVSVYLSVSTAKHGFCLLPAGEAAVQTDDRCGRKAGPSGP